MYTINIPVRKKITLFLLYVFVANVVFLPNDTFQLKKISFAVLIILNFDAFLYLKGKLNALVFCFAVVLPIYIISKSLILTGDLVGNVIGVFTGFMLLLYFVIQKYEFDFEFVLMRMLMILALFMVSMAILDFVGVLPTMSNPLLMWFYNTDNAMIGRGVRHAFGIIYFMKASPLLLLCLPYCIKNKKYIWTGIVLVALIISGTRANFLMGVIVFLVCFIYKERDFKRKMLLLFLTLIVIYIGVVGTDVTNIILNAFTIKESNDLSRRLSLQSIFSFWEANPLKFFIGSGYSSEFYNLRLNQMVSNTELSYWNLLRRVGFFTFLVMMYMFLYPSLKTCKFETLANIGYLAYLVVAYTNPLLYSSTGITALLYMYYLLMRFRQTSVLVDKV